MKKFGAIDIGTNSMRILIASVENGKMIESYKHLETTRIGEGVDNTGNLSEAAIERNISALKYMLGRVKEEGIQQVPIIATSAVRDAQNKNTFLERVERELGVAVEVISGEREAELGFFGVLKGLKEREENILVIDIGGGSTEFIYGSQKGINYSISLDMGAVRMTEKYMKNDPIMASEIEKMTLEIDGMMMPTIDFLKHAQIDRIIGIGGTVTTIVAVTKGLEVYDPREVHNFDLLHEQIQDVLHQFKGKNLAERRKMPGLQPKRADVITAGAIILDRILTLLDRDEIRISEYDNLEGLVFEAVGEEVQQ